MRLQKRALRPAQVPGKAQGQARKQGDQDSTEAQLKMKTLQELKHPLEHPWVLHLQEVEHASWQQKQTALRQASRRHHCLRHVTFLQRATCIHR